MSGNPAQYPSPITRTVSSAPPAHMQMFPGQFGAVPVYMPTGAYGGFMAAPTAPFVAPIVPMPATPVRVEPAVQTENTSAMAQKFKEAVKNRMKTHGTTPAETASSPAPVAEAAPVVAAPVVIPMAHLTPAKGASSDVKEMFKEQVQQRVHAASSTTTTTGATTTSVPTTPAPAPAPVAAPVASFPPVETSLAALTSPQGGLGLFDSKVFNDAPNSTTRAVNAEHRALLDRLKKSKVVYSFSFLQQLVQDANNASRMLDWPKGCKQHTLVALGGQRAGDRHGGGGGGYDDRRGDDRRRGGGGGGDRRRNQQPNGGRGYRGYGVRDDGEEPEDAFNILTRTDDPFRIRKAGELDPLTFITKQATGILNKISRETFAKLSEDMLSLNITSQEMLERVIDAVFDKALEDVFFQDLHADLCKKLGDKAAIWSDRYLRFQQFSREDGPAGAGWYFDVSGSMSNPAWQGPFENENEAKSEGRRLTNFKRLLLNRCQQEFMKDAQFRPIDMEQANDEEIRTKAIAEGALTDDLEKELSGRAAARAIARQKIKRRMLANISFIGHLYNIEGMLTSGIMYFCIGKLINNGNLDNPDEESIEAFVKLLTLIGKKLDEEEKTLTEGKRMPMIVEIAGKLTVHPKLSMRVKFAVRDLMDLRKDGWALKGAKASIERQTLTLTREELHRKTEEERRAAEQHAASASQASRLSGIPGGRGLTTTPRPAAGRPAQTGPSGKGPATFGPNRRQAGGAVGKGSPMAGVPGTPPASPGDGWTTVPSRDGKSRPGEETTAEAPKGEILTGDALKRRLHNAVDEFSRLKSFPDLEAEIKDLAGSPNWSGALVVDALRSGLASPATFRDAAGRAIAELGVSGLLVAKEALAGVEEFMQSYSDLAVDAPKIAEYTAQVLGPAAAEGILPLSQLVSALRLGVASGSVGNLFAQLVNAVIVADKPAREVLLSELAADAVPFASVCTPGRALKKVNDQLGPSRAVKSDVFAALSFVVSAREKLDNAITTKDAAAADAVVAFMHEVPVAVKTSKEFARLVFAEAVDLAKADGDAAGLKDALGSVRRALHVCLNNAESASGSTAEDVAAYVLNGVQVAIAIDDSCGPEMVLAAFEAFNDAVGELPAVKPAGFLKWADGSLAEPVGRTSAEAAVSEFIAKLRG